MLKQLLYLKQQAVRIFGAFVFSHFTVEVLIDRTGTDKQQFADFTPFNSGNQTLETRAIFTGDIDDQDFCAEKISIDLFILINIHQISVKAGLL